MKKSLIITLAILCYVPVMAQNVTVVFSQNKCQMHKIADLNKMFKEHSEPILNALVKEKKLISWGVLTHAWGDEWNWNIYYVAESQAKFQEAWSEYYKRVSESNPDFLKEFGDIVWEHKDSIYTEIMSSNANADADEGE